MNRILVVDDDHDILTVVEILLTMNDFIVKAISKWNDITDAIKNFSPNLILLDIALGGADGREICSRLKKSNETRHIPVILFSAHYDLANDLHECMANGLVTKPFDTNFLLDTLRKHLV